MYPTKKWSLFGSGDNPPPFSSITIPAARIVPENSLLCAFTVPSNTPCLAYKYPLAVTIKFAFVISSVLLFMPAQIRIGLLLYNILS